MNIRRGTPSDVPFLREMLYEAAFFDPTVRRPPIEVAMAEPKVGTFITDWGRPGDTAVIAVDPEPVGGAWYRIFTDTDHSYGYVDAQTPELAIGMVQGRRGQGIGTKMLLALVDAARGEGFAQISLSVSSKNYALRVYEKCGFERIRDHGGEGWTMLLRLQEPPVRA